MNALPSHVREYLAARFPVSLLCVNRRRSVRLLCRLHRRGRRTQKENLKKQGWELLGGMNVSGGECQHCFTRVENRLIAPADKGPRVQSGAQTSLIGGNQNDRFGVLVFLGGRGRYHLGATTFAFSTWSLGGAEARLVICTCRVKRGLKIKAGDFSNQGAGSFISHTPLVWKSPSYGEICLPWKWESGTGKWRDVQDDNTQGPTTKMDASIVVVSIVS